mgnify:FL=1
MPVSESHYPDDWFFIAIKDLERVAKRLQEHDVDDAAFRLQQAIEKCLKGYLLSQGWQLKRTHDVEVLLDAAVRYDHGLERYRPLCRQVTGYYIIERYPTFEEGPSISEVRKAYRRAQGFARRVQALAGETRRRG